MVFAETDESGIPVCPKCGGTNIKITVPEDRYDRNMESECKDCNEEFYVYDES